MSHSSSWLFCQVIDNFGDIGVCWRLAQNLRQEGPVVLWVDDLTRFQALCPQVDTTQWVQTVKKSIAEIAPHYTTKRMMDDYFDRFYTKLANRSTQLRENNFAKVKEIVRWKEDVASKWDKIEVLKLEFDPVQEVDINNGKDKLYGEVVIDKKELAADLGLECVVVDYDSTTNKAEFVEKYEFDLVKTEGSKLFFQTKEALNDPGTHQYALRIYPKNAELPHRMDFAYVKWIS